VKPHIFKGSKLGDLLSFISSNNYQINGCFSVQLTMVMAEEFFNSYRGVFPDYSSMIESMVCGPLLALTISSKNSYENEDIVNSFRDFCGPNNPELARILRPKSLRAAFGETIVRNAVHCTDLPEDGEMECRYFFDTLANL
jgi:nucleoside-diphosphate kinase